MEFLAGEEGAAAATLCQPRAYGHEAYACVGIELCLGRPRAGREVVRAGRGVEHGAVRAAFGALVGAAVAGMVAYAGEVPHVVHNPYQALSGAGHAADVGEVAEALVDPCENHRIGLGHKQMTAQREAVAPRRHLEDVGSAAAVVEVDVGRFFEERNLAAPRGGCDDNARVVGALVCHEHAGVDAGVAEGVHEAPRHHCRASARVAEV